VKDDRFEIVIDKRSKAKTLTIHANGIGMSREEVITHIGTIAKSGTADLLQKMRKANRRMRPHHDRTIWSRFYFGIHGRRSGHSCPLAVPVKRTRHAGIDR